eukprot:TRINITY_DN10979_c0_g2_i1.p2 TRINITY_DN10979_c0_g2~~TRINITY_DN10979_c0_g2_i1.p2  ORF type:complete len:159 (-),score=69.98 TRINITY_DN10979_c0_g2_i1:154-579(-)
MFGKFITLLLVIAFALLATVKLTERVPDVTAELAPGFVVYAKIIGKYLPPQLKKVLKEQGMNLTNPKELMKITGVLEFVVALLLPFTFVADLIALPICFSAIFLHVEADEIPKIAPAAVLVVLLFLRIVLGGSSSGKAKKD